MAFDYAVALTGGIATGKSSATVILSLYGFRFIDADKIAHAMLDQQYQKIAELFGADYVVNEKVDRVKLGKLVFADTHKRKMLEALLHPLIYDEIVRLSEEQEKFKKPYIVDIPLFFENRRYPIKRSVVCYAPKSTQIERLMKRDGFTEEEALRRVESQMDIEEKRKLATYVIDNSKDLKQLQNECQRVKDEIIADFVC
jgi:dephospho-CoA kinase